MAVQPQHTSYKKSVFDKAAAIGTVCVGVGGAAAALALKSSVDAQGKRLDKLEEKYDQTVNQVDVDNLGRLVRSLERRIYYLEDLLERNGVEVAPPLIRRNDVYTAPPRKDNIPSYATPTPQHAPPTTRVTAPNRILPTRGELVEKSEQELESAVDADIY